MYEGFWKNDQFYGKGRYIRTNGESLLGSNEVDKVLALPQYYEGAWLDGKKHGRGILYGSDGKLEGKWKNDKYVNEEENQQKEEAEEINKNDTEDTKESISEENNEGVSSIPKSEENKTVEAVSNEPISEESEYSEQDLEFIKNFKEKDKFQSKNR